MKEIGDMGLDFINIFYKKLKEKNINWEISALVSPDGKLYLHNI